MKKLLLFILPFSLSAESNYTYTYPIAVDRDPVVELMSEIHLGDSESAWQHCHEQYTANSNLIRDKFLIPYLEYQAKKLANKMEVMQYEHEIEKSKLKAEQKLQDIKIKFQEREALIAESFHASLTCKVNGLSWFELTDEQRAHYRETFIKYHSQQSQK